MSSIRDKFRSYIESEIKDINFDEIYEHISVNEEYIPEKLIHVIEIVLYHLELKEKLNPEIIGLLNFYRGVLKEELKIKIELSKNQLLYLIQHMYHLVNKERSQNNLYI